MENTNIPSSIVLDIDYRKFVKAFIKTLQSDSTGTMKRCICIPLFENGIVEDSFTDEYTKKEIRTAKGRLRLWHVTEEGKAAYKAKYGKEKTEDWDAKMELSKQARENLERCDPATAARLNRRNDGFDSELAKQLLPYVGKGYSNYPQQLPPEQVETIIVTNTEGDDDLPF